MGKNKITVLTVLLSSFLFASGIFFWTFSIKNTGENSLPRASSYVSKEIGKVKVPDLTGKNFQASAERVSDYELVMLTEEFSETVPEGNIISQTPEGGTDALSGFTIAAKVSKGSRTRILPDIAGKTLSEAAFELTSISLSPFEIRQPGDIPEGIVLGYRAYEAGETVNYGERIAIVVSSG
jgi:serine/threonine-protein kinase